MPSVAPSLRSSRVFELTLLPFPSRSQELQSETADLRERIKHLNDMVFCQQRKVKAMIEEVRLRFIHQSAEVQRNVAQHPVSA